MNLSGDHVSLVAAFLGGVIISFTPCVYPLIPVSAGYIGIRAAGSKIKGFILSTVYVTGIAVTYSLLGILASLTGTLFGRVSSHPLTYLFVGMMIIIFGLSMLDLFSLSLPNIARFKPLEKQVYLSTFLLGLSSGLVASPCLTPALGTILFYLATQKNLLYGAALLFSFAYGMGLVLILAGTFSGILLSLPKPGRWLAYIKKACALILVGIGGYFIFAAITKF